MATGDDQRQPVGQSDVTVADIWRPSIVRLSLRFAWGSLWSYLRLIWLYPVAAVCVVVPLLSLGSAAGGGLAVFAAMTAFAAGVAIAAKTMVVTYRFAMADALGTPAPSIDFSFGKSELRMAAVWFSMTLAILAIQLVLGVIFNAIGQTGQALSPAVGFVVLGGVGLVGLALSWVWLKLQTMFVRAALDAPCWPRSAWSDTATAGPRILSVLGGFFLVILVFYLGLGLIALLFYFMVLAAQGLASNALVVLVYIVGGMATAVGMVVYQTVLLLWQTRLAAEFYVRGEAARRLLSGDEVPRGEPGAAPTEEGSKPPVLMQDLLAQEASVRPLAKASHNAHAPTNKSGQTRLDELFQRIARSE